MINDGVRVMFIPTGGFGWVIGDRPVAESGASECVLTLPVATPADVDQMITQARKAGATVITTPGRQPWGYAGVFADPDGHVWMVSVQS
ncbi:VOC family protein [Actinoallomurus sp. NPDC052274]|uniref:VOC family protein n=1 Tax=Actinoallomurus sp. NPDC052274 TaxID=3155420 RepID=UPI00341C1181